MHDPETEGIVFIGEIGGDAEETVIFFNLGLWMAKNKQSKE